MIIAEVEFLRGIEWQRMESMGFFFCDFTDDGCKCADMHPDHVEMHKIAMHEFIKGIQPGTDPMACPTCTPTFKLTKLFPPR